MLALSFLSHYWKSVFRNAVWRRNLGSKIMLGILFLYLLVIFITLGVSIKKVLASVGGNPVTVFNSYLVWYFAVDLLLRCSSQSLPTIDVVPYLRLQINRKSIVKYLLIRALATVFNFLPWIVFIPYIINVLSYSEGAGAVSFFVVGMFLLMILNNYLAVFLNYLSQRNIIYFLIPILLVSGLFALKKLDISIESYSANLGRLILEGNIGVFILFVAAIVFIIWVLQRMLRTNFYIDDFRARKENRAAAGLIGMEVFNRFGDTGKFIALELNMLLRNKRTRQVLISVVLFWIIFGVQMLHNPYKIFFLLFVVSLSSVNYGQFLFSWESSYFDGIISRKNNFVDYVKAKYYILSSLIFLSFAVFSVVSIISGKIDFFMLTAITLFSLGVGNFFILFFGTYNNSRIALNQSQFFNHQGTRANTFLLSLTFILVPLGVYGLAIWLFNELGAKIMLGVPGLIMLLTHNWWISNIIVPRFMARKYKNLEGFRKLQF
jgi:Predicted signaling protein consisting of a modified GGDEF domain and a DHH domain